MGQKQEVSNTKAIFAIFAIIFATVLIYYTLFFVYKSKNIYNSELDRAISVQTASANTVAKLYKYVKLPNNPKPFAVLPYEYSQNFGNLALVSKTKQLDAAYVPKKLDNITIPVYVGGGSLQLVKDANIALNNLNDAAKKAGYYLMARSAYRSYADQKELKQALNGSGLVAEAGESEHQTGLAVDINSSSPYCGDICALDASTATWLANNAPNYGFILRYPQGQEAKTGYPYESWHFRYVGVPAAKAIAKSGLTFDEAYALIAK